MTSFRYRGVGRSALAVAVSASLVGCGTVKRTIFGAPADGTPQIVSGFIGGVVADEPRAALVAKQVLATGGNAADAAVALGMMLSVTLPSRAGLGGGGACVVYQPGSDSPNQGQPEALLFAPAAPAVVAGDRPAAVPMLARGLYLLSARYGTRTFAAGVGPAASAAKVGFPVSRALAADIAPVAHPLAGDPAAASIFAPGGVALGEGGTLVQPELAETLSNLATSGFGDLYSGATAHRLAEASVSAGGPISVDDLRNSRAARAPVLDAMAGPDRVALLPQPLDGGIAAAAALAALQRDPSGAQGGAAAGTAAASAAAQARGLGAAGLPLLPASTSFTVLDRNGGAVSCALTMNNLFGTGRIVPGTGILLAASPAVKPAPLLEAGIVWNDNLHAVRAVLGASGQNGAALALAYAAVQAAAGAEAGPVPEPGRANVISCPRYAPGEPESCRFTVDPRVAGLAASGG